MNWSGGAKPLIKKENKKSLLPMQTSPDPCSLNESYTKGQGFVNGAKEGRQEQQTNFAAGDATAKLGSAWHQQSAI